MKKIASLFVFFFSFHLFGVTDTTLLLAEETWKNIMTDIAQKMQEKELDKTPEYAEIYLDLVVAKDLVAVKMLAKQKEIDHWVKDKFGKTGLMAVNYPTQSKIYVNYNLFSALVDERRFYVIVLHEYLGIIQREIDHYRLSNDIITKIGL